jgi:hypothetical protein
MADDSEAVTRSGSSFSLGDAQNSIALSIEDDLLRITVRGDPPTGALLACFREAFDTAALTTRRPTLVDLSAFNGRIDWTSVRQVGSIAPWSKQDGQGSRVAYVTDSLWFTALLKLVKELYPETQHRQFDDVAGATAWLATAPALRQ